MSEQYEFFYPNRMGKIILRALEEIAGPEEYKKVLKTANLEMFIDHPPSGDLERQFPFEYVAAIQSAVESVWGAETGREMNRRVVRGCRSGGLQESNLLNGIANLPVRMLQLGLYLHVACQ